MMGPRMKKESMETKEKMNLFNKVLYQGIGDICPLWQQAVLIYGIKNQYITNLSQYNDFVNSIALFEQYEQEIMNSNEEVIKDILRYL